MPSTKLPRQKRATILVMGPRGSGKTTFVNLALGSSPAGEPSTPKLEHEPQEFELDGVRVALIDTPGFSDNDMASWQPVNTVLADQASRGQPVTGVIYVHSIADNRLVSNLQAFDEICAAESVVNSTIATVQWELFDASIRQAQKHHEKELVAGPFSSAFERGTRIFRSDGARESVLKVVRYVMQRAPKRGSRPRRDGETASRGLRLEHTGAGQILLRDLSGNKATEDERLEKMRKPRRSEREQAATDPSKIRLRRYNSGDVQGELRKASSRIKLRHAKSREGTWKQPNRTRGLLHHAKGEEDWDMEKVAVSVCCGLAMYVLMAVFRA